MTDNESSSPGVNETDEDGTDFGDGETKDPGATTQKTMRSVLREVPERPEEEETREAADMGSNTAGEASRAEAEQTDNPASSLGEPIRLTDPAKQFSLGTTDGESTPQSHNDSASGDARRA